MKIERISPISGKVNEMDIDISEEQLNDWKRGTLIQHAMPQISPSEREFILTGITSEEWDALFAED